MPPTVCDLLHASCIPDQVAHKSKFLTDMRTSFLLKAGRVEGSLYRARIHSEASKSMPSFSSAALRAEHFSSATASEASPPNWETAYNPQGSCRVSISELSGAGRAERSCRAVKAHQTRGTSPHESGNKFHSAAFAPNMFITFAKRTGHKTPCLSGTLLFSERFVVHSSNFLCMKMFTVEPNTLYPGHNSTWGEMQ